MSRLLAAALAAVLAAPTAGAFAHEVKSGNLILYHPWTRATPSGIRVAAGYVRIENKGSEPDRLIGGSVAASDGFEIHDMTVDNGVMTMRSVTGGVAIPPHGTVTFKPGALHLMFTGLREQLVEDQMVDGTLVFEHAGKVPVEFMVESIGGTGTAGHQHDQK